MQIQMHIRNFSGRLSRARVSLSSVYTSRASNMVLTGKFRVIYVIYVIHKRDNNDNQINSFLRDIRYALPTNVISQFVCKQSDLVLANDDTLLCAYYYKTQLQINFIEIS